MLQLIFGLIALLILSAGAVVAIVMLYIINKIAKSWQSEQAVEDQS
jgi:hypothetical protein